MVKVLAARLALVGLTFGPLQGCQELAWKGATQAADAGHITADELAIVVNQRDPLSQQIADYYQNQRKIPAENVIQIEFDPGRTVIPVEEFRTLWLEVQNQTPDTVQAYALTWAQPYRVGCMSITSAFAFGFNEAYCSQQCAPTAQSIYFNSEESDPFSTLQVRPTMALAAETLDDARALIDRGVAADGSRPFGTAYLMNTSDSKRNVRSQLYPEIELQLGQFFPIQVTQGNELRDRADVMFYFTGLAKVPAIQTNGYLPGAVADHLTSFGGQLTDSGQMSSLKWLQAGATGSYGTVVEPCNIIPKFPHPGVLMAHYLDGDTLIEAYWKSVLMPGQGIFIGEPLARPFGD
jgi:uncharacterized protein (TIGR03790 family)